MKDRRLLNIMNLVKEKGFVTVSELAKELGVSEITIRRDLNFLEAQGLLERRRGGAVPKNFRIDIPFFFKLDERKEEKIRIAKKALTFLSDGQIVAMSGGTTIFYVVQSLDEGDFTNLTIVTNSITTAWGVVNQNKKFKLIHSGGIVRENSFECIGKHALELFENIMVDVYLMGVNGIDLKGGITTHDFEERDIAVTIMRNSQKVIVLADSSKFGIITPFKICDLDDVDVIITDSITQDKKEWFEGKKVQVILA